MAGKLQMLLLAVLWTVSLSAAASDYSDIFKSIFQDTQLFEITTTNPTVTLTLNREKTSGIQLNLPEGSEDECPSTFRAFGNGYCLDYVFFDKHIVGSEIVILLIAHYSTGTSVLDPEITISSVVFKSDLQGEQTFADGTVVEVARLFPAQELENILEGGTVEHNLTWSAALGLKPFRPSWLTVPDRNKAMVYQGSPIIVGESIFDELVQLVERVAPKATDEVNQQSSE